MYKTRPVKTNFMPVLMSSMIVTFFVPYLIMTNMRLHTTERKNGISIFAHIGNVSITFSKFSINYIVVKTRIFEIFILKINM